MSFVVETREGSVAVLTLNNPDQLNAGTLESFREIAEAVDRAMADPQARAILITGAGRGFCAGAQLGEDVFGAGAAVAEGMRASVSPLIERICNGPKPVVAAVNGPAAGAGVGLALAADITLAARSAAFVLSFARLGATLDAATSLLVQRAAGVARAKGMALLARPVQAEEAERWGLIWRMVEDEALMDEARAVAEALADGPPLALAAIKRQFAEGWAADLPDALEAEAEAQGRAFMSEDLREGVSAFTERRKARFRGR